VALIDSSSDDGEDDRALRSSGEALQTELSLIELKPARAALGL